MLNRSILKSKRIISLSLVLMLMLSIMPLNIAQAAETSGLENFTKTNSYIAGQFSDVAASAWYANSVAVAYELGLVKGSSATTFNPTGNITTAETIVLACRLHNIYNGGDGNFIQGSPWYQVYVDYARENNIISGNYLYNSAITRFSFVNILSNALPKEEFNEINVIEKGKIPDVEENTINNPIYLFYRAGILTGSDKYGTFNPNSTIQRSEVAAIVTRIADSTQRKTFNIEEKPLVPESISLSGKTSITVGESVKWTATITPSNANQWVQWISGNPSVAIVDANGNIKGLKSGQSNITAIASNGIKKTVLINVQQTNNVIYVSANNIKLNPNDTETVKITFVSDLYDSISYEINDESILSCTWSEWDGDDIELYITPINSGATSIRVFVADAPNIYETIYVTVTGASTNTVESNQTNTQKTSSLTIEGVGKEYTTYYPYTLKGNVLFLHSADYEITTVEVLNEIHIVVEVIAETLEFNVIDEDYIGIEYELYDDRNVCVKTGEILIDANYINQKYSQKFSLWVDKGNYTLKFKDMYR